MVTIGQLDLKLTTAIVSASGPKHCSKPPLENLVVDGSLLVGTSIENIKSGRPYKRSRPACLEKVHVEPVGGTPGFC